MPCVTCCVSPRFTAAVLSIALMLAGAACASPPPLDPPRGDMRVAVFGDFNGPYGSTAYPAPVARVLAAITKVWRPELLLFPGDVVAGQQRSLPDDVFGAMWAAFDERIAAPLREAGIPYALATGNHDGSSLRGRDGAFLFARERRAAEAYWGQEMYREHLAFVDRSGHPFDYAFVAGEVFVAILDASSATVTREQREWLESLLRRPAATSARVRVVVGHLPLVPVGRGRDLPGEVVAEAQELRRVMEAGGVDLYISGHHAAYYPGRLGALELLFAGGVGARKLLAGDAPARSTVTLVDVWYEPMRIRYSTFDAATMELVPAASLPPSIGTGAATVRLSDRAAPSAAPSATPGAAPAAP